MRRAVLAQSQEFPRQLGLSFRLPRRRCRLDAPPVRLRFGSLRQTKIPRRSVALIPGLALWALLCLLLPFAARAMTLEVYYVDPCGGCREGGCGKCTVEKEIFARYTRLLKNTGAELALRNISFQTDLLEERRSRIEGAGLDPAGVGYPTVFVGEALFAGDGSQDADILACIASEGKEYAGYAALIAGAEDARVAGRAAVFLYSPYCESCRKVRAYLRSYLPEAVEWREYSLADEEGVLWQRALMKRYDIAEEDFFVPFVLYGQEAFMGSEEIYLRLTSYVAEHAEEITPTLEELNKND